MARDDEARDDKQQANRIAALGKQLDQAREQAARADAKVAEIEGQIAGLMATSETPLPQIGTVTSDAAGAIEGEG